MNDFRKLKVYIKGRIICNSTFELCEKLDKRHDYGLRSQMERSAISITSNIAEGCGRGTQKELKRYLHYSLGSVYELESQFNVCSDRNYLDNEEINRVLKLIIEEQKMLNSLIKKIRLDLGAKSQ